MNRMSFIVDLDVFLRQFAAALRGGALATVHFQNLEKYAPDAFAAHRA